MLRIGDTQRMNSSTAGPAEHLRVVEQELPLVGLERELTDDRADHRARGLGPAVQHEQALLEDLAVVPRAVRPVALRLRPDAR